MDGPAFKEQSSQTTAHTYSSILQQTQWAMEVVGLIITNKLEIDSVVAQVLPALLSTAKAPTLVAMASGTHPARAFVMHGVASQGPIAATRREVERAFKGMEGAVSGMH